MSRKPPAVDELGLVIDAPQSLLTDDAGRPLPGTIPEEPKPPGYNAADPKQVEAAKKEAGQRRREDRDFYQVMMATPVRRAAFYRLLESCHAVGENALIDVGTSRRLADPLVTYLNLGEYMVGRRMMEAAIAASLDLYSKMIKEQNELKARRERDEE
jgi:hypothetical protein